MSLIPTADVRATSRGRGRRRRIALIAIASAAALHVAETPAAAQCQWQTLGSFNPLVAEDFGRSVAAGDSLILAGSPLVEAPLVQWLDGTMRLSRRYGSSWSLSAALSSGQQGLFGTSVAVHEQCFVVGDPAGYADGALHIFRIDGGVASLEQVVKASEFGGKGNFAGDVALFEDVAIVGASQHQLNGIAGAGAAFLVRRVDGIWVLEKKLTASTPMNSDAFGSDVAIAGDVAVVGALGVNGAHDTTGAVFVYRRVRDVWTLEQTLTPTDPATGSKYFGEAVAIDAAGLTIAVGAERTAGDKGAVHLYAYDGAAWQRTQVLVPPAAASTAHFGGDVALTDDGRTLVVGAYSDYSAAPAAGAAYVYRLVGDVWQQVFVLAPEDGWCVGASVAVHGDVVVVGDPCFESFSGRVHVLAGIEEVDCNGNGVNDGCDIASGSSADADQDGVPDECRRTLPSADLDGDGVVNGADLGTLLGAWGRCPPAAKAPCAADLDGDGIVDGADLAALLGAWGPAVGRPGCNDESEGTCCAAHPSPGCDDSGCCGAVCAADPFCCASHWDAICVDAAQASCGCPPPPGCGDPGAAGCCLPGEAVPGSAGCGDAACCELVCDYVDPFCCNVEWDASCATWALQFCAACPPVACGLGTNDCCAGDLPDGPGCNDLECCLLVCDMNPFCCEVAWDFICAVQATLNCPTCAGMPEP